jgi:UDP-N-acetylglucosamine:LPS N-acetylglucosamine transferase
MSRDTQQGFVAILGNRNFVRLWIAQTIGLAAQNGVHFVQMVMIERLTGSSTHMGLMILAFSLPGVFFSTFAGVAVDRLPKKLVLVMGTLLRVLAISSYVIALKLLDGWQVLVAIYVVTFLTSSIAQFFSPALWAKVPLIIGEENLLAANALFNLTYAIAQAAGLIVLAPLAVKLIGIENSFLAIAGTYLTASVLLAFLPGDKPSPRTTEQQISPLGSAWKELREGWRFITSQRDIYMPMTQLTLIATLIMVMAMLAPGFSARVLGMAAEDAVYVFAPAGVGMLMATVILGRFAGRMKRETWINLGLMGTALGFGLLGLVSDSHVRLSIPLLDIYPQAALSVTSSVMGIALFTGFFIATVNTVAQTALQERSPSHIRGRVYSVQFLMSNLIGIPPLLGLGTMADHLGIPIVCFTLAGLTVVIWGASLVHAVRMRQSEERAIYAQEVQADRECGKSRILLVAPARDAGAMSAAHALIEGFKELAESAHISLIDGADLLPGPVSKLFKLYRSRITRGSWLWKAIATPSSARRLIGPARFLSQAAINHALLCHQPDVVICLDPIFSHLLSRSNHKLGRPTRIIAVITDLIRIHPLWLCEQVDLCVVPTEAAEADAIAGGAPREIVTRIGLPISPLFDERLPRKSVVRQYLGWPADTPTILVVTGQENASRFFQISHALARCLPSARLIIIADKNRRLSERLQRASWEIEPTVLETVDSLPDLMAAADLIITRAGSSITAEALAAHLPIVFIESPRQEAANVTFIVSAGVGIISEDPEQIAAIVGEWLRPGNHTLEEMSERARRLARPAAAAQIAAATMRLIECEPSLGTPADG